MCSWTTIAVRLVPLLAQQAHLCTIHIDNLCPVSQAPVDGNKNGLTINKTYLHIADLNQNDFIHTTASSNIPAHTLTHTHSHACMTPWSWPSLVKEDVYTIVHFINQIYTNFNNLFFFTIVVILTKLHTSM